MEGAAGGGGDPSSNDTGGAGGNGGGPGVGGSGGALGGGGDGGDGGEGGAAVCVPTGGETCSTLEDDDCDGTECGLWGRVYGDTAKTQSVRRTAIAPNGDLYVLGTLGDVPGGIEFAGAMVTADAAHDGFLAKISSSGQDLWIRKIPKQFTPLDLVATQNEGVVLAGHFAGTIDLGGGDLTPSSTNDSVIAAYEADGGYAWAKMLEASGPANAGVTAMARGPAGDIVMFGAGGPGVQYDGEPVTTDSPTSDAPFLFAVDDADGILLWSHALPNTGNAIVRTGPIDIDAQGNIVLAGDYSDPISLGGSTLPYGGNGYDSFVARFGPTGEHLESYRFCSNSCEVLDVATGPAGEIYLSGGINQGELGGVDIPSINGFIARMGAQGSIAWYHIFFTIENYPGWEPELAIDAAGDITFAATFGGYIDLGFDTLTAVGTRELVVGKLHPDGTPGWYRRFGAQNAMVWKSIPGHLLNVQPNGQATLAFNLRNAPVDFGSGPLVPFGQGDVAVVQLAP